MITSAQTDPAIIANVGPNTLMAAILRLLEAGPLPMRDLAKNIGSSPDKTGDGCMRLRELGYIHRVDAGGKGQMAIWGIMPGIAAPLPSQSLREKVLIDLIKGPATALQIASRLGEASATVSSRCSGLRDIGLAQRIDAQPKSHGIATWGLTPAGHKKAQSLLHPIAPPLAATQALAPPLAKEAPAHPKAPYANDAAALKAAGDMSKGTLLLLDALGKGRHSLGRMPMREIPRIRSGSIHGLRRAEMVPGEDPRPIAPSRDPCPQCATKGDLGCKHFRPCEPPMPRAAFLPSPSKEANHA